MPNTFFRRPRMLGLVTALTTGLMAMPAAAQSLNDPVRSPRANLSERVAPYAPAMPVPAGMPFEGTAAAEPGAASIQTTGARAPTGDAPLLEPHPDMPGMDRTGSEAARTIVGWDSRMRYHTQFYPNRALVLIAYQGFQWCTGFMVSPNTLVTSGHCVHSGGPWGNWYNIDQFQVFPGRDGTNTPFGSCSVQTMWTVGGWVNHSRPHLDYGAMRLSCNIGSVTGWFGVYAPRDGALTDAPIRLIGYPGDRFQEQWGSSDMVRRLRPRLLCYRNDTVGGHSGSPVWNDRNNARHPTGAYAFGVHGYGFHPTFPGLCGNPDAQMNTAVRFRPRYVDNIIDWINE